MGRAVKGKLEMAVKSVPNWNNHTQEPEGKKHKMKYNAEKHENRHNTSPAFLPFLEIWWLLESKSSKDWWNLPVQMSADAAETPRWSEICSLKPVWDDLSSVMGLVVLLEAAIRRTSLWLRERHGLQVRGGVRTIRRCFYSFLHTSSLCLLISLNCSLLTSDPTRHLFLLFWRWLCRLLPCDWLRCQEQLSRCTRWSGGWVQTGHHQATEALMQVETKPSGFAGSPGRSLNQCVSCFWPLVLLLVPEVCRWFPEHVPHS